MFTAVIVGNSMVHKSIFKNNMVYVDGKIYEVREMR
jgi:hypothetical protein